MIEPSIYQLVADDVADMQTSMQKLSEQSQVVNDMVSLIKSIEQGISPVMGINRPNYFDPILRDTNKIIAYESAGSIYPTLDRFVFQLQSHVEVHSGDDINVFLSTNGILVKQIFADISLRVGFEILPINIAP